MSMAEQCAILRCAVQSFAAVPQEEMEMWAQENKVVARRYFEEVLNEGKLSTLDEVFSAGLLNYGAGLKDIPGSNSQRLIGDLQEVKELVSELRRGFPDLRFTIHDQVAEADRVVTRWAAQGTHLRPFSGVPASGKQLTMSGITVFRLFAGRIVERWNAVDRLAPLQQMGLIQVPGTGTAIEPGQGRTYQAQSDAPWYWGSGASDSSASDSGSQAETPPGWQAQVSDEGGAGAPEGPAELGRGIESLEDSPSPGAVGPLWPAALSSEAQDLVGSGETASESSLAGVGESLANVDVSSAGEGVGAAISGISESLSGVDISSAGEAGAAVLSGIAEAASSVDMEPLGQALGALLQLLAGLFGDSS